jgi:hypothetical protein
MNRRELLKTLGLTTLGAGLSLNACKPGRRDSVAGKKGSALSPDLKSELRSNKHKGKLIFTFASLAYAYSKDRDKWPRRPPMEGMRRVAGLAHKYHIPVTWLTDMTVGTAMKDKLDEWHEKYGDDIGVSNKSIDERKSLKALFPWSEVNIVQSSHLDNETHIAEKLGYSAIWGSCWEQHGIDGISDRGAPWGMFYVSDDNYKIPALKGKGPLSMEWTARDLLKALHSGRPTTYSSDPNDVARSGLCSGDDITYWKALFDNYIRNIANNKFVFFQQQQESHEMENDGKGFTVYTPDQIDEAATMLDKFFAYIHSFGDLVEFKALPEAMQLYNDHFSETEPSVMLFDDVPVNKINFWYGRRNRARGPWPKTLLYYDKECQLAFIEGKFEPILDRDYIHNRQVKDPRYYRIAYEDEPSIDIDTPWRAAEPMKIPVEIKANKAIPYGVTFWYDFNRYKIKDVKGAKLIGPIQNQVALLRLNLKKGMNKVVVHLRKIAISS